MNLFLYLQITDSPEEIKFSNPIIASLKEHQKELMIHDFDNHSDILNLSYINKLLNDSDSTLIFIDTNFNSNFSKLMPFFTNLLDNPENIKIILRGNNPSLEKMISILPHSKIPENTYGLEQIVQFFAKIF
ncbi:hypothetical protein LV89_01730 [Arcicella aurantiaca]|uniref:Uncharacterized protein n=1 Tax=Arcicella aurantiaca TaxID=591202 RepID=A0A316EBB6_9BACT|nr:hypothetical protein [Arcicella aurantiaca]PWK27417.1 hypothetical protein LV89_01730 [Arcicella aurantiaca]